MELAHVDDIQFPEGYQAINKLGADTAQSIFL